MADESTCDRLRGARERLGLTPEEVASAMGLSAPWYYDLEAYPEEVFSTVSLKHLQVLGQTLGLEPAKILVGKHTPPTEQRAFRDVADGLQRRIQSEGLDTKSLGERLGWEVSGVLADPEELWGFNVIGLREVCEGVGIDWLAVLPRLK